MWLILPVLLLGLAAASVSWVPLARCPNCLGRGEMLATAIISNLQDPTPDLLVPCPICSGRGKVTVLKYWKLERD